jgi:coenzyme F420-reducing hydrogenase beta subunit
MIQIEQKVKCSGCAACYNSCNHGAISMQYDDKGFSYPVIDNKLCIDCHLCEKVCPYLYLDNRPKQIMEDYPPIYACYNKNENIRKVSTSGGIFSLLADKILDDSGVVFAVRFNENFHIVHSKTESKDEIQYFRGSKYAQSEVDHIYRDIRNELKNNRKVLFVGLPCQVAGLKQYINKDNDNLYTCDFICMGIASSVIWDNYLHEFEDITKLKSVVFKDKRDGWHNWKIKFTYPEKETFSTGFDNLFFNGYLHHLYYRPSCFECPFKGIMRVSDFTIADCWGIDKIFPEFDDNKGATTLIVQSKKAKLLFQIIQNALIYRPINAADVMHYNKYSVHCAELNSRTDAFYEDLEKHGFRYSMKKYCGNKKNLFYKAKQYISECLR